MLGDGHQLDMGEAEVLDIGGELRGELTVRQTRSPGSEMDLVDGERRLVHRAVGAVREPLLVAPHMVRLGDDGGGRGRHLRTPCHRVGAHRVGTVGPCDVELVERALADPRHEQLPHPAGAERAHRQSRPVPVVEVTGDPYAPGIGRPDGEAGAGHALVDHRPGAERPPQLLVPALADQMQIELAEGGQEAVRVPHLQLVELFRGLAVPDEQEVLRDGPQGQDPGEEAVAVVVQPGPYGRPPR